MKKIISLTIFLLLLPLSVFYYLSNEKYNNDLNSNIPSLKNVEVTKYSDDYDVNFEDVAYYNDIVGFYAEPVIDLDDNIQSVPAVVMIHEWWGLNENIKEQAKVLASYGYRVLAVDLFGTVATTREQAMSQVQSLNSDEALSNMTSAIEFLKSRGSTKVASLGWCFGGAQSLQLSLNQDLDATVIYYGNLVTDEKELSTIQSPVLGIFGEEDRSISVDDVNLFEQSLTSLNISNDINIYPGVGHAFANPSGDNYAEKETLDAFNKTLEFLNNNLK